MAFNKGLQLVDGNPVKVNTVYLGDADKAFFQSQLVGSSILSQGSSVFTIRPDNNDDTAGAKQELVKGQNLVLGIEYNTAGDQYRLIIQAREDYDNSGADQLTKDVVTGDFVDAAVETTFGLTYNANGTISLMQTGSGLQVLSLPNVYTAKQASIVVEETAGGTSILNDVAHLILDDGRGNVAEIVTAQAAASAGNVVDKAVAVFAALSDEDKAGFELVDASSAAQDLEIKRSDGASFTVTLGAQEVGDVWTTKTVNGVASVQALALGGVESASTYTAGDFFSKDYDGFVSLFSEFEEVLTISELAGYVNNPETVPGPTTNSDAKASVAVLTIGTAAGTEGLAPTTDDKYNFTVTDQTGNQLAFDYTESSSAVDTFASFVAAVKADFDAAADKKGYSLDTTSDTNVIIISRADGADFKVDTNPAVASDYATNLLMLNDEPIVVTQSVYTSKDVSPSTGTLETVATPTGGNQYEIVLDAGGTDVITVTAYNLSGGNTVAAAIDVIDVAFDAIVDKKGFTVTDNASSLDFTRADGKNFTVKLGSNDAAANLQFDSTALAKDSTVSTFNGSFGGSVATVSNKVVQKIDFTTLSSKDVVVGSADSNYAGEATLQVFGMSKATGPATTAVKMSDTNAHLGNVSSTGYTGAAAVSSDGKVSSDVIFTQVRDVADGTGGYTVDFFVDPFRVGGDYQSVNFTVEHTATLDVGTLTVVEPTGGYKLANVDGANNKFSVNWFQPAAVTDLSAPIATVVFTEASATDAPSFTFKTVDVDGVDYTDNATYTQSFSDSLNAAVFDVTGVLEHGNDSTSKVADQLVTVTGFKGASAANPAPTNGLHLDLASSTTTASTDSPNMSLSLVVKTQTQTNDVSFEIDLPATAAVTNLAADPLVDPASYFTLDAALTDWTVNSATIEGRTLKVDISGVTNASVGDSLGTFSAALTGGFGATHEFEMLNVQTDADAATESGRGLYVGQTRTGTDGTWKIKDMPIGTVTRAYDGTAEISNAVTALDAYYALQVSAGLAPQWYTTGSAIEGQMIAADFDGSGKVTAADALAILNYAVSGATPDPVVWKFFDTDTTVTAISDTTVKVLSTHETVDGSGNVSLTGLADEVVLIGDLSNPA
ncbi:hypothetical protein N9Y18_06310 [Litoricolaceae bacterium]|nr:hypothetical protein [Litorivicinaceae bacterium]